MNGNRPDGWRLYKDGIWFMCIGGVDVRCLRREPDGRWRCGRDVYADLLEGQAVELALYRMEA
jgi:hypothetical protein